MDEIKVNDTMMQVTKVVGEMIEFMRPYAYRMCLKEYGNMATEDELK